MKKTSLILVFFFIAAGLSAQNLVSPVWKISFDNISETDLNRVDTSGWKEVNLLLSWERQDYYADDGKACMVSYFTVPKELSESKLNLSVSLQCDVRSIYINGRLISGRIRNLFWTNRGARTTFSIPADCLNQGKANQLAVFVSNLSYTGGISVNYCGVSPDGIAATSEVKIDVPVKDHNYNLETSNYFTINYNAKQKGVIHLKIVNDFHQSFFQSEYAVEKGKGSIRVNFDKAIKKPGFYECMAIMDDGGYSSDVQWMTLAPEKVACTNKTVPGFKAYWDETRAELEKISPDFNVRKVDSLTTSTRTAYIAEMKSLNGLTIRGYYFVPKTAGKHAAVLHLPGYGNDYKDLRFLLQNQDDVIELALCVRGHGISADVFNPGFGMPGIWGYKLCSKTEVAYRGIYMDCVRAVEFLLSRSEVDASRIGVMGGSQGGALTLATAGLCPDKIKACAFFDPGPCDARHHLEIRTLCKREVNNFLKFYNNECSTEDALAVWDLIDSKGFAEWIRCPTFFVTSLFDDDIPPHLGFSAYNRINAQKGYKIYPNLGHLNDKTFGEQMQFLKHELGF